MPRLELYPFRYRHPLTKKWVRARYVAERHEIAARRVAFEIIGPPGIREVRVDARHFNPAHGVCRTMDDAVGNLGPIGAIGRHASQRRFIVIGVAT